MFVITELNVAIIALFVAILLWSIDRFIPKKRQISIEELENLFKIHASNESVFPEIRGNMNSITIINVTNKIDE